jgi:rhodanese-related sulfurtransferase
LRDKTDIALLTALDLKRRFDAGEPLVLLDVREPDERAYCSLPTPETATDLHVPMQQVAAELSTIVQAAAGLPTVVYCHLGQRSMVVARWLIAQGLRPVLNLEGGIDAWSAHVDPGLPRY